MVLAPAQRAKGTLEAFDRFVRQVCIGQAGIQRVGRPNRNAGQGQVGAKASGQAGQEVTRTDVREQADADLGHGHARAIGDQAQAGALRDPHAASHDDAVHQCDIRLGIAIDGVIELVLRGEKLVMQPADRK